MLKNALHTRIPEVSTEYTALSRRWVEIPAVPYGDDGLACHFRDVTHQRETTLQNSERRFQQIAEDALHRATLERGFTTTGTLGHGFWMMLHSCDRLYLLTGANGTTVVMEQERATPKPMWMQL